MSTSPKPSGEAATATRLRPALLAVGAVSRRPPLDRHYATACQESLASVREARAYQIGDLLLLRILGDLPSACHLVDLEQSLFDVEPPAFIARLSARPDARCAPRVTPYEYHEAFRIGSRRQEVTLHRAEGPLAVSVEELTPGGERESTAAAPPARTALEELLGESAEAVGYSRSFDLGEAMRDAIANLPERGAGIPDWLSHYYVVAIGAEIGGIAGSSHLYVRVRG